MFIVDDPEISAEELTRRVDEEARRQRAEAGSPENGQPTPLDERAAHGWAAVHRAIAGAERCAEVGVRVPPMTQMRGLRRRLAVPIAKLVLRVAQLVTREQVSFNVETVGALRAIAEAAGADVRRVEDRLATVHRAHRSGVADLARHRETVEGQFAAFRQAIIDTGGVAEQRASSLEFALWSWRQETVARLEADAQHVAEELARLRTELLVQERHLGRLLETSPGTVAAAPPRSGAAAGELDHLLDAFYTAFEDRFRGPRDEIKTRLAVYLPIVLEAGAGTPERPILDLGCGRGEWLELLREHGSKATGLDANLAMVAESRRRGCEVVEGDALAHLRGLPDRSLGAVTAFHLIEHLPFTHVLKLLDEMVRVLRPGGVVIVETPNPQNLAVGACRFYIDPTHQRPLHPDTMAFVAEQRGLARVQVRFLHPVSEGRLPEDGSPVASRLNELLLGPQDFAVIGYRP